MQAEAMSQAEVMCPISLNEAELWSCLNDAEVMPRLNQAEAIASQLS
jgi:hypothetical protein